MAQSVVYLDPSKRVEQAWERVRELRAMRFQIEQDLVAAEAALDIERKRETPGGPAVPFMSVTEAAKRIGVSDSKIWKAIRTGALEATRIGRNTRITESDLMLFVRGGKEEIHG